MSRQRNEFEEFKKNRVDQIKKSLDLLNEFKVDKCTLQRPVFFVPGWTDESCKWWQGPFDNKKSLKDWFSEIFTNPDHAHFVNFEQETKICKSFLDFGEVLKHKVQHAIGEKQSFDMVGHSMGGLDIRAAITQGEPLLNCNKCISVATPHHGDNFGGMMWFGMKSIFKTIIQKVKPMEDHHIEQAKYLDPDYFAIKIIDSIENRKLFFQGINRLYQLKGTRDFLVKGSAYLEDDGVEEIYKSKVQDVPVGGCDHTGDIGITTDPRTILAIVYILCDLELPQPDRNYGIFSGGIYKPADDSERFV